MVRSASSLHACRLDLHADHAVVVRSLRHLHRAARACSRASSRHNRLGDRFLRKASLLRKLYGVVLHREVATERLELLSCTHVARTRSHRFSQGLLLLLESKLLNLRKVVLDDG